MDDRQQARVARNEAAFRSLNEQQAEASREFHDGNGEGRLGVLCECADPTCHETLELDLAAYEHVRSNPRWFAVRAEHVVPEVEVPVEEHGAWWIVEKVAPIGARIAEERA